MRNLTFWTYSEIELVDLIEPFSKLFNSIDLTHDYENVWEWLKGSSSKFKSKINVSREHDWEKGEYDKPLIIHFYYRGFRKNKAISEIGKLLANEFKREVNFGNIDVLKDDSYKQEINKIFHPDNSGLIPESHNSMLTFDAGKYQIKLSDESEHNSHLENILPYYEKKYLTESNHLHPTIFGIKVLQNNTILSTAIIGAEGGASVLHNSSQIIHDDGILLCCSDSVFCIELPTLNLTWKTRVDMATAFGIFQIGDSYIVHGETEISRVNNDGEIIWKVSGEDIFVAPDGENNFELKDNYIKVRDWNNRIYKWDYNGIEIE